MKLLPRETPDPTGVSVALLLPVVAFLIAGCSGTAATSGQAPHYAGTFEASCSPVDAPGLMFGLYRLGDAFPAQVSISIWQFEFPMEGSQIRLRERGGYGAAYISGTEWIPAVDGEIGLESYVEQENASGWFWLELDGFERVEGRFEANWSDGGLAICG